MKKSLIIFSSVFLSTSLVGCNKYGLYVKEVTLFKENSTNKSKIKLYFTDKNKGVPYINLHDGVAFLNDISDYKDRKGFKISDEIKDNKFTLKRENGASISFDTSLNVIRSEDINKFKVAPHALSPLDHSCVDPFWYNESGEKIENEIRFTMSTNYMGGSYYIKGNETIIDLNKYNINLYKTNNNFYCPFTTFYNVTAEGSRPCAFNGENLFLIERKLDTAIKDENNKTMYDYFYSFNSPSRPKDLIDYNYNELCRSMDFTYGLKEGHGINNGFDDYFTRTGVKDYFYKDAFEYNDVAKAFGPNFALSRLTFEYIGDLHTSFTFSSPYGYGKDNEYNSNSYINSAILGKEPIVPTYLDFLYDTKYRQDNRINNGLIEQKPSGVTVKEPIKIVGVNDKTMILTFDKFRMNTDVDFYYSDQFKNNKESYIKNEETGDVDLVALTSLANDKFKADEKIKNIVIDLSANTGGMLDAAIYLLCWLNAGKTIMEDKISGAKSITSFISDINFDKKYDSYNDTIYYKKDGEQIVSRDVNVYCLTSKQSFSCGNFVPAMLKQTSKAKLIGTTTGGGACIVYSTATADGSGFNFSSNNCLCQEKNGTFYDIDRGIDPDYYVDSYETLYGGTDGNRQNIIDYINNIK